MSETEYTDKEMEYAEEKEYCLDSIIESILFASGKAITPEQIAALFPEETTPSIAEIKLALDNIEQYYADRGIQLQKVASGYRFQIRQQMIPWIHRLWEEKPPRYTRALLETLALIAYRQPVTRGEIEEVRGVAVSSSIIRTLQEREWVRMVGHRDVPGRPAMYATTRQFLDYFNLTSLNELPPLGEIKDLDKMAKNLEETLQQAPDTEEKNESNEMNNLELPLADAEKHTEQPAEQKEQEKSLLLDHEQVKAFQEEKDKQDQQIFNSVDELLASVKTDFTDYDPATASHTDKSTEKKNDDTSEIKDENKIMKKNDASKAEKQ